MFDKLVNVVGKVINGRDDTVLLLSDVGVSHFEDAVGIDKYGDRMFNLGIMEPTIIGCSAGLSQVGLIPIVFTYGAFLVERCFEQLKIDVSLHNNRGNYIARGGSYDFTNLGPTHHSYSDVNLISNLPGFEIAMPGTPEEFEKLFLQSYDNHNPTYYKITEHHINIISFDVEFGKANVVQEGRGNIIVVAFGTSLNWVLDILPDYPDVTVLYYTTLYPFDKELLSRHLKCNSKLLVCEPTFRSAAMNSIIDCLDGRAVSITTVGIPFGFIDYYGSVSETDNFIDYPSHVRVALEFAK